MCALANCGPLCIATLSKALELHAEPPAMKDMAIEAFKSASSVRDLSSHLLRVMNACVALLVILMLLSGLAGAAGILLLQLIGAHHLRGRRGDGRGGKCLCAPGGLCTHLPLRRSARLQFCKGASSPAEHAVSGGVLWAVHWALVIGNPYGSDTSTSSGMTPP
jgi:hypothetical protein